MHLDGNVLYVENLNGVGYGKNTKRRKNLFKNKNKITPYKTIMKTIYTTLLLLVLSVTTYAQGISVQGIARDNTNAAITNTNLPFTFSVVNGSSIIFSETQDIRTDNFGLFSHVVSSGTATDGTFNNIDFSIQDLKLQVVVNYNGTNVTVYDQKIQYVPYAHYAKKATDARNAENGVPPGTVVAFLGDDSKIPDGWVKAKGQSIASGDQYAALRAVIGNTIPDLRARFLRGQGQSSKLSNYLYDENTTVGQYLDQTIAGHKHYIDITENTSSTGSHRHNIYHQNNGTPREIDAGGPQNEWGFQTSSDINGSDQAKRTDVQGAHTHSVRVTGDSQDVKTIQNGGQNLAVRGEENRPWTVVVNYIIKL
jgi:hypothetical protein